MKGKLLRPRAEGVFAHEQAPLCDLPFERGVRGGIVDVQPAGKDADEPARGKRAVDGGAVAPFGDARDDRKARRQVLRDPFARRKIDALEMSWILETNTGMNNMLERIGAEPYKRYRLYEKQI